MRDILRLKHLGITHIVNCASPVLKDYSEIVKYSNPYVLLSNVMPHINAEHKGAELLGITDIRYKRFHLSVL